MNIVTPTVKVGQIWEVEDRVRSYPARVIAFKADRVQIREVCRSGVVATPTLARPVDFVSGRYRLLQEATC